MTSATHRSRTARATPPDDAVTLLLSVRATDQRSFPQEDFALLRFTLNELRALLVEMETRRLLHDEETYVPDERASFHRFAEAPADWQGTLLALRDEAIVVATPDFPRLVRDDDAVSYAARAVTSDSVCWRGIETATQLAIETAPLERAFLTVLLQDLDGTASPATATPRNAA